LFLFRVSLTIPANDKTPIMHSFLLPWLIAHPRRQMTVTEGPMFRILSVGNDSTLLESRAALLRYTGAEVDSADVLTARSAAMLRKYDLLLLCQSVPLRDAAELHEICRFRAPQVKTLLLGADIREDAMQINVDGRLNSLDGPTALINEVSGWMRRTR
jgi:hypothetical protein